MCHASFDYGPARVRHMRNVWKGDDDPTRCDKIIRPVVITAPVDVPVLPVITAPAITAPLTNLARRQPVSWEDERTQRSGYTIIETSAIGAAAEARQMSGIQEAWKDVLRTTKSTCSENFWKIFLKLHTYSTVAIDSSLQAVKKVFVPEAREKKSFLLANVHYLQEWIVRALFGRRFDTPTLWICPSLNCQVVLRQ